MTMMEIDHEIGSKTNIYPGLVLGVCMQKTEEEPGNQIGYNVGKDDQMIVDYDHGIGNKTDISAS